jgi:hypothetical protein
MKAQKNGGGLAEMQHTRFGGNAAFREPLEAAP